MAQGRPGNPVRNRKGGAGHSGLQAYAPQFYPDLPFPVVGQRGIEPFHSLCWLLASFSIPVVGQSGIRLFHSLCWLLTTLSLPVVGQSGILRNLPRGIVFLPVVSNNFSRLSAGVE